MGQTILSRLQAQILTSLSQDNYIITHFFLTGGTALSEFYFHHRYSEDFDLFAIHEFDNNQIFRYIAQNKKSLGLTRVEQQVLESQLTLFLYGKHTSQPVKVDFAYFPFDHLGTFKKIGRLRVSSLEDIVVNKLQAITTRTRARDYLDLMLCLEHLKWDTEMLVKNYRLKYDLVLPVESTATAYTNVQVATDPPLFLAQADWPKVVAYFLSLATIEKNKILQQ